MHYHVLSGISGYMPDTNQSFTSRNGARHYLSGFIKSIKDEGYVVEGSVNSGHFHIRKGYMEELPRIDYVEITQCHEKACELAMKSGVM